MEPYFFLSRSYSEPESVAKSILTNKKSEITNGPALIRYIEVRISNYIHVYRTNYRGSVKFDITGFYCIWLLSELGRDDRAVFKGGLLVQPPPPKCWEENFWQCKKARPAKCECWLTLCLHYCVARKSHLASIKCKKPLGRPGLRPTPGCESWKHFCHWMSNGAGKFSTSSWKQYASLRSTAAYA